MKNYIYIILFALIYGSHLFAQSKSVQTISGVVYNSNKETLELIPVGIEGTSLGAITDSEGKFSFQVPEGNFKLTASSMEYTSTTIQVSIKKGENKILEIILGEKKTDLDEIFIYGKTSAQRIKEGAFSVNVIDLSKYANSTTDVNQVLKRSTGITIREDGGMGSDFTFKINGLDAKIFIDGVPMENFGSAMNLNNIPVNLVERVEVYKGVVPAYLGTDALGGAVNIITKRKNRRFLDVSYGYGSFNTHQASLVGSFTDNKTGLVVKLNSFYNYSDNDYTMYTNEKYNVILEKVQDGHYVQIDKAKRFHDRYRSAMGQLEAGFENKKWADRFLLGVLYSENNKQNQLGATINTVKGGEWSESKYIMPTLSYQKNNLFTPRLFADLYTGYSKNTVNVRDTATYNYDWTGQWVTPHSTTLEEKHTKYIYKNFISRINLNYDLNESKTQSINANYNFNTVTQNSYDIIKYPSQDINLPSRLGRHIGGLAWQSLWFNKKLTAILSAKYYGMDASKSIDERVMGNNNTVISGEIVKHKKMFNYFSGSLALRYQFKEDLGIKFSIEKAYNLPSMTGLFGDGQNYLSNWDLKPEQSKNINLGGYYNVFLNNVHYFNFDISGFYRNASDYISTKIVSVSSKDYYQFYNEPGVNLYGLEAEVKYGYKDLIQLTLNGSYDKAIDNKKYTDETNSQVSLTYKNQLPNRPWLYGNADLTFSKKDLIGKNTRLQASWLYQYSHWYYLSWEGLGFKHTKDFIPSQSVHSVILGYSWKNEKYNCSFEARNLTDERCYDNFRLQKPGRAFYMKFRISIM